MIYYVIPYIILILTSLLSLKISDNGYKFLFFIGLIPAILIVVFRGVTGTDTYTYLMMLNSTPSQIDENYYNVEFGFLLYTRVVNFFEIPAQIALNFLGFIVCVLLYMNFSKSKHSFVIFSALIFPVFFYDMTMNGVRYGLAFALAIPFITEPITKLIKITKGKFYFFLAILNHNSVLLFIFLKIATFLNLKNILYSIIIASGTFYIIHDYLLLKFNDYLNYKAPSLFSGLQPLIVMFLIFIINTLFYKSNFKRNFYMFLLQLCFYGLTQISYAGIRFQFAVLFFMIVYLTTDEVGKNYRIYLVFLYFIGFLGFILKSRNMVDGFGIGMSPFLPYLFIGS